MNALTILAALLVIGCAALEEQVPALDTAATRASQYGGCVKFVCAVAIWSAQPLQDCRMRPGSCRQ